MNYATQEDMINLFGQTEIAELSNLDDPNGEIDAVKLEEALNYASREIDSYLVGRYQLPLVTIPLVLRNKAADIARYHLDFYKAREDVRLRYEDAVKWLQSLAAGKVGLGIDRVTEEQVSTGGVQWVTQKRVFHQELMRDYGR